MKKNQLIFGLVVLAALVAIIIWGHDRIHFDFRVFRAQLALADWRMIGLGFACICLAYAFRAVRWAQLLKHNKKVPPFSLLGTQVIGFTAIALLGRVADPVRPYLVAKKTGLSITSQIAVYIVERLFDAGSMALIFSSVILLAPAGSLPHAEAVRRTGIGSMIATVAGALFLVAVRMAGDKVAGFLEGCFNLISKKMGRAVREKILSFHAGLDTMRSFSDFAIAAALSLGMWLLICVAYLETARAFVASPQLASIGWAHCVVLMAVSGAASAGQLPVIGWFSQIGIVAAAISSFYGASAEASTACAATLLLVTFLGIVPVGLIWAQLEHVNLRKVTVESEHAEEELEAEQSAGQADETPQPQD